MTKKRRKRHSPEQIVKKLRDADAMLNAGNCHFVSGRGVLAAAIKWTKWTFTKPGN